MPRLFALTIIGLAMLSCVQPNNVKLPTNDAALDRSQGGGTGGLTAGSGGSGGSGGAAGGGGSGASGMGGAGGTGGRAGAGGNGGAGGTPGTGGTAGTDAGAGGMGGMGRTDAALRPTGDPCATGAECSGGICADGVCCATACSEVCKACNLMGSVGTCSSIGTGKPPARAGQCAVDPANKCGNNGFCDGTGKCQQADSSVVCGAGSCDPGSHMFVAAPKCNGRGACTPASAVACSPAKCNASGCLNPCSSNDDCVPPNLCLAGSCGKADNGARCTAAAQCKSNFCVDGVCCNSSCAGQCEACDLGGATGACRVVTGVPHGGRAPCGNDAVCGGSCDGVTAARCTYPSRPCRTADCSGNSVIPAASCNNGVCPPPSPVACSGGTPVCRAGACVQCAPNQRRCSGSDPSLPQICTNGAWQNEACDVLGNREPFCDNGSCGHQCERSFLNGGVRPAPLACASLGSICPIWNFDTGTNDGWALGTGNVAGRSFRVENKTLDGRISNVLVVGAHFEPGDQMVVELPLCPGGINIRGKYLKFRMFFEGPMPVEQNQIYPRAIAPGGQDDFPNGVFVSAVNRWIDDRNCCGFVQEEGTARLQMVVTLNEVWDGTIYLDDLQLVDRP